MAIELITGRAGKAHIESEDDRAYHAYTNGEGRYILNGGTVDIESVNNVHIDPAEFLVDGAHVRVTGAGENVVIENGVSSYKRIDVIALHYTSTGNEGNYVESVEFVVVKGANVELSGKPQVPNMPKSGTILTGADDVYVPVYSLLIDGLTPKNPTMLLEQYALPVKLGGTGKKTLSALIDSVWDHIKTEADTVYAKVKHVHAAADITSGTLPISMGGTGSGDINVARGNLGVCKRLWAGTHSSGSLNIPGISKYKELIVVIQFESTKLAIPMSIPNISGATCYYDSNKVQYTIWAGGQISGENLTLSSEYMSIATNGWVVSKGHNNIIEIWGIG